MAKKVEKLVKLQIPAGKATPAPPVGPALGQAGINNWNDHTSLVSCTSVELFCESHDVDTSLTKS
ncbi:hypothetical protein V2P75_26125, partial [Bordetella bronchiseptica]